MIVLILFDMNDVLCRYDKAARIAALARLSGRAPDAIEAAIWGSGFEDRGDAGELDAEAYLRGFGERIGHPLSRAEWTAAQRAAITPMPEMLALAGRVGQAARIAVLTNNSLLMLEQIDAVFPELRPVFGDAIHVSAEFRARKPQPEAYRRCLRRLGADPAETLFIDDGAANVAGAEEAGLAGHRFVGAAELAAALQRHGLLPTGAAPASRMV
ncbi:HAD family hydrolase [Inquilinus sp. NPDC058860]|uniref:HAD family hydrolase n=1 Tax=Inquilinus sp. NPDC058860 TaxID=3346652 RepID=UPI0036BB62FA